MFIAIRNIILATFVLFASLLRIDEMLGSKGTRFLTGDTMCCFDCELMPKLQHIRVAGECRDLYRGGNCVE